jgi:hypothetical protein
MGSLMANVCKAKFFPGIIENLHVSWGRIQEFPNPVEWSPIHLAKKVPRHQSNDGLILFDIFWRAGVFVNFAKEIYRGGK